MSEEKKEEESIVDGFRRRKQRYCFVLDGFEWQLLVRPKCKDPLLLRLLGSLLPDGRDKSFVSFGEISIFFMLLVFPRISFIMVFGMVAA